MMMRRLAAVLLLAALPAGCAIATTGGPQPQVERRAPTPAGPIDARHAERLQRIMVPLVRAADNPRPLDQVRVGIVDDPAINAASAGNGEFYVTRGLLEKANDEQLAGVLAHEIAHDDLKHVAQAQARGAGLSIGMIILDQIFPGSGAITPIAGTLIDRKYSRQHEYEADRHGMELLRRAGLPPEIMLDTLTWLIETSGGGQGGFFATHPATADRIEALRRLTRR
jgi:Zn-dependent protease with chaperone function